MAALRRLNDISLVLFDMRGLQEFFRKRIEKDGVTGMPLTVLIVSASLILFGFIGLMDTVRDSGPIVALDQAVTNFLFSHRSILLDQFFYAATQFGSLYLAILFIFLTLGGFIYIKKRSFVLPFIITIIGAEITNSLLKLAVQRVRPGADIAFYLERSFSFPSGHACISVALYGFIIYALLRIRGRDLGSRIAARILIVLIILIGFSRVYLGVHYVSDVLGGYLVGLMWLLAGISFKEIFKRGIAKTAFQ
ncbi:MAG: phosphoesterase, PA-phosphatase related protein [Parcubacteria group bacterium]|nr:phosphoesterase, PA-phosphatase related protein [Parcubacteria group bacterium]